MSPTCTFPLGAQTLPPAAAPTLAGGGGNGVFLLRTQSWEVVTVGPLVTVTHWAHVISADSNSYHHIHFAEH